MKIMNKVAKSLLLIPGALVWISGSVAQETPLSIPRVAEAPVIDGAVSEEVWSGAQRVAVNVETRPGENVVAPVDGYAMIMEDGETLYVAFVSYDPDPAEIRAYFRDRDRIGNNDRVGIVIDTFNDERRAYEFFVNPFGVQHDAINDDVNNRYDSAWNAIWESAGQIHEDNFTVEMAIPLKQLRFPEGREQHVWGVDFVRLYPRDRDYRIGSIALDRDIACYLCKIAKAEGLANIQPTMNLEIVPTLTTTRVESRDPAVGSWETGDADPEASLDVRWGISPNLYLNATINPDFSQVEADGTQLDTNTTFSLYFPERRTFFLDGADYFNTFLNIVHTRNIASPDYGVKLTGKSGAHTYGLLSANDEATSFLIPRSLGSSLATLPEVESDIAVMRYRYDVFDNSAVGAIVTDRRGEDYQNTVIGIDGVFQLTDSDTLRVQSLRSETDYPLAVRNQYSQAAALSDETHIVQYRHNDSNWNWFATYEDFGKDFRADMGFISQVDYRKLTTRLGHTWHWDDSFLDRLWFAGDWDKTLDQSGLVLEEEVEFFLEMGGPMQSWFNTLVGASETYYDGQYFDEQFNQIITGFRPFPDLSLGLYLRVEDVVDFANSRLGHSTRIGPSLSYSWGPHVQLGLDHTHQEFDVDGGRLFTADLTDVRATYQFSSNSFLRLTLQYVKNERDQSLYNNPVESHYREMATQLLYSYRLNAASRFYIGYSDSGFQDDTYDSIEPTNRTVFAKFSYAWLP